MARPDPGNHRLRMPVVFGPGGSPRGGEDGRRYQWSDVQRTTATVSFLTDAGCLRRFLPAGLELGDPPVVSVEWTALRNLPWLAGRGYNTLGVRYGARFRGTRDTAEGPFLAVLWENRPEPIVTGREELGFAKLYCELPEPRVQGEAMQVEAAWESHVFCRMALSSLKDAEPPRTDEAPQRDRGTLHYRYFPRVSAPGEHDIAQVVLTPSGGFQQHITTYRQGAGSVAFIRSDWEALPTLHHIVNALAGLPVLECLGATYCESRGAKDLSDQRVLI